jgi:proteasome lid subunit RPN8/RPN11
MRHVRISSFVIAGMFKHARKDQRKECSGLLAGREGVITTIFPARNVHPKPETAYEIAPKQLFRLFRKIRGQRLEFLGIYHSHPSGENSPSPTDIERAFYPDAAYFVISPRLTTGKHVRAFRIRNARAEELRLEIV